MINFFKKIPNIYILVFLFFILGLKLFIYILISTNLFDIRLGGGSDANYYHQYAIGQINTSSSIWPDILSYLNNMNLYSREGVSNLLFIINLVIIPLLLIKVSGVNFLKEQKNYLYCFFVSSIYLTLYFYSVDIYRDTFMVLIFLLGCFSVKKYIKSINILQVLFYLTLILSFGVFLYKLRPYLGYAFLGSLLLWKINFNKKRILFFSITYLIILFFANYFGFLDSLTDYRSEFEEAVGGSNLGLNFQNSAMFIPYFVLSLLGQLFGLYITNPIAVLLFIVETIPFIFMLKYIVKNINYADGFVRFLIIFFVLYGSVWLIGNDNLGTAVRLRLFNYISVYICFFYILSLKNKLDIRGGK